MYIILTQQELIDVGAWEEFTEMRNQIYIEVSVKEDGNKAEFQLEPQEFMALGLSLAAHD